MADELKKEDLGVSVVAVNMSKVDKDQNKDLRIAGYPTIRLYFDSGEYIQYHGDREKESIKAFLLANGVKPNK